MRPKHFTLVGVLPKAPATLALHYADGEHYEVDVADVIQRTPSLKRLKQPSVFAGAKVGEHGASVAWGGEDDLELAADNLRARAIEQAGGVSHEFVWNWMARHELSLEAAAQALGVSRRMLAYYRSGAKPVPRTVALACVGWEDLKKAGGRFKLAA